MGPFSIANSWSWPEGKTSRWIVRHPKIPDISIPLRFHHNAKLMVKSHNLLLVYHVKSSQLKWIHDINSNKSYPKIHDINPINPINIIPRNHPPISVPRSQKVRRRCQLTRTISWRRCLCRSHRSWRRWKRPLPRPARPDHAGWKNRETWGFRSMKWSCWTMNHGFYMVVLLWNIVGAIQNSGV